MLVFCVYLVNICSLFLFSDKMRSGNLWWYDHRWHKIKASRSWYLKTPKVLSGASQVALVVKYLPANARDTGDAGLIPRLGRSPGEEHGNPLQYSYLENPMDREAWWTTLNGVTKSWTWLSMLVHTQLTQNSRATCRYQMFTLSQK